MDASAVAPPPPVSPSTATAESRTPRTHALLNFSDDDPDCPIAAYRREVADFHRPHTAREIRNMPDTQRTVDILNNEILILLSAGRMEEAVRFYRTASAISLAEARQAVEDIDTLRDKSNPTVRQTPESRYLGIAELLAAREKQVASAGAPPPTVTRSVSEGVSPPTAAPPNPPAAAPPDSNAPRIVAALLCGLLLGLLASAAALANTHAATPTSSVCSSVIPSFTGNWSLGLRHSAAGHQVIDHFSPHVPAEVGNNPAVSPRPPGRDFRVASSSGRDRRFSIASGGRRVRTHSAPRGRGG